MKSLWKLLGKWFWTKERIGKHGETLIARDLKLLYLVGKKGKILRNLYLPAYNDTTSEIDLIFITPKGIFVMESKNYSGWISGRESSEYWTQTLANQTKYKFYNPIKQNQTHINMLRQFLNRDIPLFSYIVFSDHCELKHVYYHAGTANVMKRDDLCRAVIRDWNRNPDALRPEEIREIYTMLLPLTKVDAARRKQHIEAIQTRHPQSGQQTTPPRTGKAAPPAAEKRIRPQCGKPLVLRTAQKGPYKGNQFYGCSGYPECRYTQTISPPDSGAIQ